MKKNWLIKVFILYITWTNFYFCQNISEKINISWDTPITKIINEQTYYLLQVKSQGYKENLPQFSYKKETKQYFDITISNLTTEPLSENEASFFKLNNDAIPTTLQYESKTTKGNGKSYFVFNCLPLIKNGNTIEKVVSFDLNLTPKNNSNSAINKNTVTSSVLGSNSGNWYKISVTQSGVVKLNKAFLESCGISTSNLNPNHINIFGNGDGKISTNNSKKSTDDLAKNAIYISGDQDGVFNDNDYILFYAWGPTKWINNSNTYYSDQNIYSDYSYYFININSNDTPLRINQANSLTATPNNICVNYDFYAIHEKDQVNLIGGGQRWYGELFDAELSQTFNFNIPNKTTNEPIFFELAMAGNETSGGYKQNVLLNNTTVLNETIPTTGSSKYRRLESEFQSNTNSTNLDLKITITRSSPAIIRYLDFIAINTKRNLVFYNSQFNFRDKSTSGAGIITEYQISNASSNLKIWNITDNHIPIEINGYLNSGTYSFIWSNDSLNEYVAFDGSSFNSATFVGQISNQNLHALEQADYLIVTHKDFYSQANRLADLHREKGLKVHVVTTEQVYNEFSSGMQDPMAIRKFAKMFYDRANQNNSLKLKYLLLFGDGSYDPKNRISGNTNFVITYEYLNSEDLDNALVSDDFFGFLDNNESNSASDLLDISIGRILASTTQNAKEQVDKIEHYMKNGSSLFSNTNCCGNSSDNSTFGDWRLKYVFVADDYEAPGNFVPNDAEPNYYEVKKLFPEMNAEKLYMDAFQQITSIGGQRYPDVVDAINQNIGNGCILFNYSGHGGPYGLAQERIVDIDQIRSWSNINRLTLFVSSTCEFTRFDYPQEISAGEWAALNPNGGAIALFTTTRAILITVNTDLLSVLYKYVFSRNNDKLPLTFGEIMMLTKNESNSGDNKRCFNLIGDPALRLALPTYRIVTDSINNLPYNSNMTDTVRALGKVNIKGHIEDNNGNKLTNYNGILTPSIYDKPTKTSTLGQDPGAPKIPFEAQKNPLFKGQSSIKNGYFDFSFYVPKDINYSFDRGKISYYGDNRKESNPIDARGVDSTIIVGGIDPNGVNDLEPPTIRIYLNNEKFADGGLTDESPTLIVKLEDNYGINTVGNGVGHDLTAVLDENTAKPIILNNYYLADVDSYQKGTITYNFPSIEVGNHKLTVKAWDINNNSTESSLNFTVAAKENISLSHVLNYPNPFTTKTSFYFEHNQICNQLEAMVQIFTISGKLVKTIYQDVLTNNYRSEGIVWDGKDDFGDQLAKGVYIYKLTVKNSEGETADKTEKLVILK